MRLNTALPAVCKTDRMRPQKLKLSQGERVSQNTEKKRLKLSLNIADLHKYHWIYITL